MTPYDLRRGRIVYRDKEDKHAQQAAQQAAALAQQQAQQQQQQGRRFGCREPHLQVLI